MERGLLAPTAFTTRGQLFFAPVTGSKLLTASLAVTRESYPALMETAVPVKKRRWSAGPEKDEISFKAFSPR